MVRKRGQSRCVDRDGDEALGATRGTMACTKDVLPLGNEIFLLRMR